MLIRSKFAMVLATSIPLAGCAAHVDDKLIASSEFAASGQGIVVFDASTVGRSCYDARVHIGRYRPDAAGWFTFKSVTVKALGLVGSDGGDRASEVALPPGEYGINAISCNTGGTTTHLIAERADGGLGKLLVRDPVFMKFTKPLATFSVAAGEVVDIGSIGAIKTGPTGFVPVFGPIAPEVRAGIQATKPNLAGAMVTRRLTPIGQATQPPAAQLAPKAQ